MNEFPPLQLYCLMVYLGLFVLIGVGGNLYLLIVVIKQERERNEEKKDQHNNQKAQKNSSRVQDQQI